MIILYRQLCSRPMKWSWIEWQRRTPRTTNFLPTCLDDTFKILDILLFFFNHLLNESFSITFWIQVLSGNKRHCEYKTHQNVNVCYLIIPWTSTFPFIMNGFLKRLKCCPIEWDSHRCIHQNCFVSTFLGMNNSLHCLWSKFQFDHFLLLRSLFVLSTTFSSFVITLVQFASSVTISDHSELTHKNHAKGIANNQRSHLLPTMVGNDPGREGWSLYRSHFSCVECNADWFQWIEVSLNMKLFVESVDSSIHSSSFLPAWQPWPWLILDHAKRHPMAASIVQEHWDCFNKD